MTPLDGFRNVPVFAGLGRRELEILSRLADEVDVDKGRVLVHHGDLGREFFAIQDGTADVTCDEVVVNTLGAGDYFGEIALIENIHRTATVTATSPMQLVVLTASSFRSLRHTVPELYETVKREIAKPRPTPA